MKEPIKQSEVIDVFKKLKDVFDHLSKSQKKIALYILSHYEKAPRMAAVELAKAVGVSEATVVRFANSLGYEGYPDFRKKLQEDVNSKLTTLDRIELSVNDDKKNHSENKYVRKVLRRDIHSIVNTIDTLDDPAFEKSVKCIANARRVFILGFRTSTMLADYLAYYLNLLVEDVRVITNGTSNFYEQLIKANENDVVIAVSFPRYAQRTIEAADFLKQRGTKIITITDTLEAPINQNADHTLLAKNSVYSFVDSLVAPMCLINALVIAVGAQSLDETKKTFSELEGIWKAQDVYAGDEVVTELQ